MSSGRGLGSSQRWRPAGHCRRDPVPGARGYLMEILRSDWPEFAKFGQVYVTVAYPGVVKGWHYHKVQTDNFIVVKGTAKVVCYDNRPGSRTKGEVDEYFPGEW